MILLLTPVTKLDIIDVTAYHMRMSSLVTSLVHCFITVANDSMIYLCGNYNVWDTNGPPTTPSMCQESCGQQWWAGLGPAIMQRTPRS